MANDRLRVSAIHYLNPAPLMWSFEHEPDRARLSERYCISSDTPAECAAKLASGAADIGLVPVAAFAANPSMEVIPGCTIASRDHVRSIVLAVRNPEGVYAVRRVALDTSSLTSVAYTKILFARFWNTTPEFVPHEPSLDAMLQAADAALLIGDPALVALEHRRAREYRTGQHLIYYDLAHEWRVFTGTVWVSALWGVRPEAVAGNSSRSMEIVEDFERSRDEGRKNIDALAAEWSRRLPLSRAVIRSYLTENIWYILDDDCIQGLELFYRYGVECGALPAAPKLHYL
ncbi:MAG TPA: menaquinone biosynthesis protein [Acidobacteriaceae bacterium]|nr:menaquinone biosynthesis protein [Acidobacteriaceae bacterium]